MKFEAMAVKTIRAPGELFERAQALIPYLAQVTGSNADLSAVLRAAIARGLEQMEAEARGKRR